MKPKLYLCLRLLLFLFVALTSSHCFATDTNTNVLTPASALQDLLASQHPLWAHKLETPGITNFFEVTSNLYRGAQPTARGMEQLKAMGIKTVVNLRSFHSDADVVKGTGLKSVRFEVKPWHAEEEDVVRFLKVVSDTNNLPVFVHCQRGADRTGMMCAMYRVVICGWTKQEAIEEMKQGGFHFSPAWKNLVEFVQNADIADIRRKAGIRGGS